MNHPRTPHDQHDGNAARGIMYATLWGACIWTAGILAGGWALGVFR